jgi:hypothetical protein
MDEYKEYKVGVGVMTPAVRFYAYVSLIVSDLENF